MPVDWAREQQKHLVLGLIREGSHMPETATEGIIYSRFTKQMAEIATFRGVCFINTSPLLGMSGSRLCCHTCFILP